MTKGKRARPEGTKRSMEAFFPEAIFNYVRTVEEYVFALSACFALSIVIIGLLSKTEP